MSHKPLVSVIVPTKNSGETIESCLKSLQKQTYSNIEVIVVDSHSGDCTKVVAKKFGSRLIESKVGRAHARNLGVKDSVGELILCLDSDMELTPTVIVECVNKIKEGYDLLIIPEVSVGVGFWAKCKALEKSCYIDDELIEASRFFKREAFEAVNGYDPELEFGEDWDLHQRINKSGYRIGRINALVKHHEGRLSLRETVLKKHRYGKTLKRYRIKHPKEAKQQLRLIRLAYMKNWGELAKDPIHALGMLFMKTCEAIAGFLATTEFKGSRREG